MKRRIYNAAMAVLFAFLAGISAGVALGHSVGEYALRWILFLLTCVAIVLTVAREFFAAAERAREDGDV